MKKFVLVSSARSGTNLFSSLISNIEGVIVLGEIFKKNISREFDYLLYNPTFSNILNNLKIDEGNDLVNVQAIIRSLEAVLKEDHRIFYKVFVEHIFNDSEPTFYKEYLLSESDRSDSVVLFRDSLLDTYISYQLASTSGYWLGNKYSHTEKIYFSVDSYLVWRDWIIVSWQKVINFLISTRWLKIHAYFSYESFIVDEFRQIDDFIKASDFPLIRSANLKGLVQKQSDMALKSYLINPDDCEKFIMDRLSDYCSFSDLTTL